MAQPIVLRFKSDTESARKAVMDLGRIVATSMASVSASAMDAHRANTQFATGIGVTALKAAASLTAMHYVAVATFAAFTAAAAAGAKELERFQKIAEGAEKANVSTTFFQQFTGALRDLKIELKAAEQDLIAFDKASRDRFDSSRSGDVSNKVRDLLQERFRGTNDFGLSNSPAMFDQARNTQERLIAVATAMRDMEASNQRLAAIDLARAAELSSVVERMEAGKLSASGFLHQLERQRDVVNSDLIAGADALKDRWEKNSQQLDKNLRPILDECARLALAIGNGAAWSAEQFTRLVGAVGAVVKALRDATVQANALNGIASRLPGIAPMAEPALNDAAGQAAAARNAAARRFQRGTIGQIARDAAAEIDRMVGTPAYPGEVPLDLISAPLPPRRPTSAPAATTPSAGGSSADETDKRTEAIEKFIRAQEKGIEISRIELETIGKTAVERARLTEVAKAEAQAREHGGRLTEAEREKIAALAEAHQRLKDALKDAEAAQRAFGDSLQYVGDRIVDMAFNGRTLSDVLKGLSVDLARSALTGQGTFARLLGTAPSASAPAGSIGGLLGLLQGGFGGFGGGGGGFNPLGFLSSFSFFHEGGVVGAGGRPGIAPASLWAGAPRFHFGGPLASDEVPIIGRRAEEVLTKAQRIAAGRALDIIDRMSELRAGGAGASQVDIKVGVDVDKSGNLMPFVRTVSSQVATGAVASGIADYDRGISANIADKQDRGL